MCTGTSIYGVIKSERRLCMVAHVIAKVEYARMVKIHSHLVGIRDEIKGIDVRIQ